MDLNLTIDTDELVDEIITDIQDRLDIPDEDEIDRIARRAAEAVFDDRDAPVFDTSEADDYTFGRLCDVSSNANNGCQLNRAFHQAVRLVIDAYDAETAKPVDQDAHDRIAALEAEVRRQHDAIESLMVGIAVMSANFLRNLPGDITLPILAAAAEAEEAANNQTDDESATDTKEG